MFLKLRKERVFKMANVGGHQYPEHISPKRVFFSRNFCVRKFFIGSFQSGKCNLFLFLGGWSKNTYDVSK
jgi:hypothetical protein